MQKVKLLKLDLEKELLWWNPWARHDWWRDEEAVTRSWEGRKSNCPLLLERLP